MAIQRSMAALTLVNLAVLAATLAMRSATADGAAGISLAGPSGTKDTYVILEAKGTDTSLKMRNESGRELVFKP